MNYLNENKKYNVGRVRMLKATTHNLAHIEMSVAACIVYHIVRTTYSTSESVFVLLICTSQTAEQIAMY